MLRRGEEKQNLSTLRDALLNSDPNIFAYMRAANIDEGWPLYKHRPNLGRFPRATFAERTNRFVA